MRTKLFLLITLFIQAAVAIKAQTNQSIKIPVWLINGNSGTNPATNFLGTADNTDLVLRTNNVQRVRVTKKGYVGIGISTPQQKLDVNGNINVADGSGIYMGNQRTLYTINGNFYLGQLSGTSLTTGNSNTGVGIEALYSTTTGNNNTALGELVLSKNTSGTDNTATGVSALGNNVDGSRNSATGSFCLFYNTSGYNNSAYGYTALLYNTTGYNNTASGSFSLYNNVSGSYNTASGYYALYSNTTGHENTAFGSRALSSNVEGTLNTAVGVYSLGSNINGTENTASGFDALASNITGGDNTALGVSALNFNSIGSGNTASGAYASTFNTTGRNNSTYGFDALYSNYSGSDNSAFGIFTDVNDTGLSNSTAIGNSALITRSNQVRIGNSDVTSIGGYTNWTNISDGRVKKNIKENVPGLVFINKLKPVTYNLDLEAADKVVQRPALKDKDGKIIQSVNGDVAARAAKEQIVYTGFIAQDVEKAAKSIGYDFSGVDAAKNDKDLYGLRYAEFVVPLVKAVQELSTKNDALEKRIEKLESLLNAQSSQPLQVTESANSNALGYDVKISPDPFQSILNIEFNKDIGLKKNINIYDMNGKLLLARSAVGNTQLDVKQLTAGAYLIKINDENGKEIYSTKVIKQ